MERAGDGAKERFSNSFSLSPYRSIVTDAMIEQIFGVMQKAKWHTFKVLTKRAERMYNFIAERKYELDLSNIHLGVTSARSIGKAGNSRIRF